MEAEDGYVILRRKDNAMAGLVVVSNTYELLPESRRKITQGLVLFHSVDDVNAAYEKFYFQGQYILSPVSKLPTGRQYFGIEDPGGIIVIICENVDTEFFKHADLIVNPLDLKS